jgi:hypothetical protein
MDKMTILYMLYKHGYNIRKVQMLPAETLYKILLDVIYNNYKEEVREYEYV